MQLNRPAEWESMGKPSIFSKKDAEKNEKLKILVDTESKSKSGDLRLIVLAEMSKRLRFYLNVTLWSAFGMYVFTIFAVRFLLRQVQGF